MRSMRLAYEAKTLFQRYYYHAIRNSATKILDAKNREDFQLARALREECAREAEEKVRPEIIAKVATDASVSEMEKEELIADTMLAVFEWKVFVVGVHLDIETIIKEAAQKKKALEAVKPPS